MKVVEIRSSREPQLFINFADTWNLDKFPSVWAIGDVALLKGDLFALFCSRKCPGKIIRKSHELAEDLRAKGIPVICGFQTPVEKMCLEVLLKGEQAVVMCPARGVQGMRLPPEWAKGVEEGRMLIVSPFNAKQRRPTKSVAELRNRFVAAAADKIFFIHASPNSRTISLARELLQEGRDAMTFDLKENQNLTEAGAGKWSGRW